MYGAVLQLNCQLKSEVKGLGSWYGGTKHIKALLPQQGG